MEINLAGVSLSYNLVNALLFVVFLYHVIVSKDIKINYQGIIPFLFLYFSLLFLTFFAKETPWGFQFNSWRASFMQTCLVAFIIWNLALNDQKFITYFKWAFIISITIAAVYGLFLMKMGGTNPYTSALAEYFGKDDMAVSFSKMQARLDFSTAAKIQSTMAHPMTWTMLLNISIITIAGLFSKTNDIKLLFLLILLLFNVFISGVRTGIAALTIGYVYYLFVNRNFKLILLTLVGLTTLTVVIQSNESLSNLFASFTDLSGQKSNISGSSITMRLNQLEGTFEEIKGNELFGKGYGWTNYYLTNYGLHPVILAFESLIFMILCNSGIIGMGIWGIFFFMLLSLNRKLVMDKDHVILLDTLVITYAAYAVGTGEYNYMPIFAMYYLFLVAYFSKVMQSDISEEKKKLKKGYIEFNLKHQNI